MPATVIWTVGGRTYEFQLHPIGTVYLPVPGLYIFCRLAANGRWDPLYVGETSNMQDRLTQSHHHWDRVIAAGATHICTLRVVGDSSLRLNLETLFRMHLNPPINRQ